MNDPRKPHLLIVEDEPVTRELMEAAAKRSQAFSTIQSEKDGRAALAAVEAAVQKGGSETVPDLILTDLSMPRMTGLQLTENLKSNPATMRIPIAMITSSDVPGDRAAALAAGCFAVFDKPIGLEPLTSIMRSLPARLAGG